ncbi:MAG: ACP S-malonyltransferase, partial [Bacteroidales bacterium]|nr:ACP S-malonyltransferase [Bacteroidales bacterium]
MKVFVFPGQGAQFSGMGKTLYDNYNEAKAMFQEANQIVGFDITDIMFNGTEEELKRTAITQPAIFIHSVIACKCLKNENRPQMVAGHSLGEFSALVANETLTFQDALLLVK